MSLMTAPAGRPLVSRTAVLRVAAAFPVGGLMLILAGTVWRPVAAVVLVAGMWLATQVALAVAPLARHEGGGSR